MRRARLRAIAIAGLIVSAPALPAAAASAHENFLAEHEIGRRIAIDPGTLPAPHAGGSASNGPRIIDFADQSLSVPAGFTAAPFATGLDNPRRLLVLPDGDVLVADQHGGYLVLLREDGSRRARVVDGHIGHFQGPYGLALRGEEVLIADQEGIWQMPLSGGNPRMLSRRGVFGALHGHHNRPLAVDPKDGGLFVGIGSTGNIGVDLPPKATIQRFDPDGANQASFASGTRNPTALAFHPETGELWALVQERDGLGDDLPSDFMIRVRQNGFYGWPYAYIGPHPQPGFAQLAPEKVAASLTPDLLFQAHSSLLDVVFYAADQYPAAYKGGAFAALRGSWNRSQPTGYKIAFVPFRDARPAGFYENFATGFWSQGEQRAEVWGRPAALAVAKDGALLVADDTGGTIWRIAYTGSR